MTDKEVHSSFSGTLLSDSSLKEELEKVAAGRGVEVAGVVCFGSKL